MYFPFQLLIVMNLITGFFLGLYLGYVIWNKSEHKGPDSSNIRKEIYKMDNGTCFRMIPYAVIGPLCERIIHDSN